MPASSAARSPPTSTGASSPADRCVRAGGQPATRRAARDPDGFRPRQERAYALLSWTKFGTGRAVDETGRHRCVTAAGGRKRQRPEVPPANRRPPRGDSRRGDPLLNDLPALASRPNNFNRPSELTLWRAIRLVRPVVPGCPVPPNPTAGSFRAGFPARPPRHRRLARRRNPATWLLGAADSLPRLPGSTRRRADHLIPEPACRLVPPVGPPSLLPTVGWDLAPGPFLGRRLTCAVRCEPHSGPRIVAGQAVFSNSQGCPPKFPVGPQAQAVHPPFTHMLTTGLCTCAVHGASPRPGHVDVRRSVRHNGARDAADRSPQHHHHSIAHAGPSHVRCQPPPGAALSFLGPGPTHLTERHHPTPSSPRPLAQPAPPRRRRSGAHDERHARPRRPPPR